MALKKPSDFFGNNKKTPLDEVKESYESARPEKIEQVSEAFDAFKSNLNHIQSLSDFTSTFDSFKNNLEKVESVSSEVSEIKEEIKSLIKKEDLDSAMMAQLLFVEESISKIESKVSSINGKTVDKIREDFVNLSNSVESFLDLDVPKYKKLISESEVRFDDRLGVFKGQVEENLDSIKEDVSKEVTTALETVESVNENTINIVKAEFKETAKDLNENVSNLIEEELPKYKKFFAETELKTEETIKNAIDSYKETIESLNAKVKVFTETEIPKYNNLLIETKLKSEQEVKELEEEVLAKVNSLSEKVDFVSGDVTEKTAEKIQELQTVIDEYKEEIDSISKTYNNLYKDFKKREISDNEKLESYSNKIEKYNKRFSFLEETVQEDLKDVQEVLNQSNETYHASLKIEVGKFRNKISEQMEGLQMDLVVNEKHIKKQNESIENIQEEIKEVLERLQLDKLEEKNKELVEKINYLEETISEINEKKLLTEDNPTLPGDPSTNNSSDGLTPLDQKFATLDDLQNHYRLFINRIQQQIATIGGGGAGFIKDLDDVTFNESTGTNQLLIYNGSKWVGIASTALGSGGGGGGSSVGAGGTWATFDSNTGITTTKKVKIDDNLEVTGVTTSTGGFVGNLTGTATGLSGTPDIAIRNITGVAATFTGVLTYEDVTNIDSIGLITARSGIKVLDEGIDVTGVSTISTGVGTVHLGVGSTTLLVEGDTRVTGILTVGSSSLTLDGVNNLVNVGTALTLGHTQGIQFHSQNLHASGFDVNSINASGISTISTGVGTVHVGVGSTALLVEGDARVTGILTIGAGSITLDPDAKQIKGIDEIIIGTATTIAIKQDSKGQVIFQDSAGKEASVGIGTTVSINTSGIITASSFVGSVTGTASNASGATGDFSIADKIVHTGDTNTAIRFPAADTVTVETSGSEALRVDSSGRLLLGTTTEGAALADNFTVADSANCGITIRSGTTSYGSIYFSDATSGADEYRGQIEYNHNTDILRIYSGGTAVLRIDPGKLEVIGHTETDTLNASGIITASSFRGDGSQLTNIISGVGIQSASTRIGTGFTDINFTGAGITVVGSGTTVTVDIPSSTITRQSETSSGVTTDFTVTGGYTVGLLDVFVNGVKQINGSDFTATDGSTVTMTPNVTDGDVVEFQKYDKLNIAGITSVTNATNAYNIVGTDFSLNTSGIITASQLAVSGLSTSKDLLVTGITSATNIIEIKSNDSTPGRIDLYCETNNAHYARLQAPEHGDFGGNITVKLPASTGTLLLSDGSGASLTSLNASNLGSGTIPDARFPATLPAISGQNLTGIVTGITAGSNITVLESPSGNFIITATGGGGGDTVSINASAGDILSASSGEISADDAGSDKLVFWDDSESKLTYLTAGSGLSISGTTITASGGGGSSGVEIENNGTSVGTGITSINFSTNVTATASGGIATVTASGGGGGSDGPSSVMMGMIF